MSFIDCSGQTAPGRMFFVGHFIPAWQVVEVAWHENEKKPPVVRRFPMWRVRSFE